MADNFTVAYNAGGDIDRVKNLKQVDNIVNLDNVNDIKVVEEIGKIKNFPTKTRPYNFCKKMNIPALEGDYTLDIDLPSVDFEILAITLTCSGYGEDDCWDMYYNDDLWFDHWYTAEVKEGLFLGTSTYVYAGNANDHIRIVFHNTGETKTVYVGIRTLI